MGRSLAEQLGAVGLSRADIGLDVTGYIESDNKECVGKLECNGKSVCGRKHEERNCNIKILPSGHKFFSDCVREINARRIEWMMNRKDVQSWFATLTFKSFVAENKARQLMKSWLYSLTDAYGRAVVDSKDYRGHGLKWVVAQEWQKRHVIHFHIIISGVRLGFLSRIRWENRWMVMRCENSIGELYSPCGFARIYDARSKAAPYLAKYVGKTDSPGDALEWGGSWHRERVPDSLRCCKA